MTDREKLVELLSGVQAGGVALDHEALKANAVQNEEVAEYLIAHGVTVKEPLKPLAYSKVFHSQCLEPQWWVELKNGDIFCSRDEEGMFSLNSYGKTWRCWAEKPTEEKRQAAEWEK